MEHDNKKYSWIGGIRMKCKYYLCMMLFSFMVLFHQYSLVKADETESTLTQKYFKLYADMTGKWDEKDGFI